MKTVEYNNRTYVIPNNFYQYRLFDKLSATSLDFWTDNLTEAISFAKMQPNKFELKVLINLKWINIEVEE